MLIFKIILINYATFCLLWMVFVVSIQVIKREQVMINWAFINDAKGEEEQEILNRFPPVDGWPLTILFNFVPIVNVVYGIMLIKMSFCSVHSETIQFYQFIAREIKEKR